MNLDTTGAWSSGTPLVIDTIRTPTGGIIGMCHAPGRVGVDGSGRPWQRSLDTDLDAIEKRGTRLMISLIETGEFARLGLPDLPRDVKLRPFEWRHLPIQDMSVPDVESEKLRDLLDEVASVLRIGGFVLFHCAAGLGRTGLMAALTLIDGFGMQPADAIRTVRSARPGTIESDAQVRFLLASVPGSVTPSV
ncbi:MAG: dual specificity protein phosphatase family protein [Bosea sp. (in: a-proteobacteria)]